MRKIVLCFVAVIPFAVSSMAFGADEKSGWVNLLPSIDPQKHGVAGTWSKSASSLSTNATVGSRLSLPWKPTAEYDFEITFTRKTGVHSIALIFVMGGNQATLDLDGWGQHLAGIQNIAGKTIRENPTRTTNWQLKNGQKYSALLKVRSDRVEAHVDGKLITTYRGNGKNLQLINLWRIPAGSLGIGAWDSETEFHQIRVRPVNAENTVAKSSPTTTKPMPSPDPIPSPNPNPSKPPTQDSIAANDIASLSDEFDDPSTLKNWKRIYQTEKTQANQLQQLDLGETRKGWLTLVPYTSSWFRDYRGVLVYKEIEGDFVVTTRVRSTNRAGNGAPRSDYSLAGIMIRTPRNVTPRTWRPGGENYIFLSLGAARQPGQFAFEVKTTTNSQSNLEITKTSGPEALIRVARIGSEFVLLRKVGSGPWIVHRRYRRTDMPNGLQVGFTVYTDYANVSRLRPLQQNTQVIRGGNPDLRASFDFMRFTRPQVPANLRGRALSDPQAVSNEQLLGFLGTE